MMFSFTQLPWEFSNQAQELLKFAKSRVTSRTVARLPWLTSHGKMQRGPFPEHIPHKTKAVHKNSVRGGLVHLILGAAPNSNVQTGPYGGPIESGVGMDED